MTLPDAAKIAAKVAPKIALVGCGMWGRNIARNLAALKCLGCVVDLNPDAAGAFSDEFSAPAMTFDQAIADDQINGVIIATSAASHASLAVAALKKGKAVYIEKPFALTMEDAEKIAAAAKTYDRPVMVGHLIRHHAAFKTVLAEVKKGTIGTLKHIRATRVAPGRILANESALFDLCPHDLALVAALTDQEVPQSVRCHGFSHVTKGIEDGVNAQLTFASGVTASIEANWFNPVKIHNLTVVGDKGALVFDDTEDWPQKLTIFDFSVTTDNGKINLARDDGRTINLAPAEPLKDEIMNFIAAAMGTAHPLTDLTEALYVQRIMTRMQDDLTQQ
jgi:UDP-2-acetamido-3-amino-2,3-dideoxy-glucuronate N-acetyltransferase